VAANDLTIYLLDMGEQIYGDCLLCLAGGKTILIDGGHQKDFTGQPGYDSIPTQLSGILEGPPFSVDLLVVTHCHTDHIGCLPEMIAAKQLAPKWALVADEDLGFGSANGPDALAFIGRRQHFSRSSPPCARRVPRACRTQSCSNSLPMQ